MIRGSFVHVICLVFLLLNVAPSVAHAQSADNVDALNNEVQQLHKQGKYAEAAKIAEHVLSQAETTLGPEHPSTLTSVSNLGKLYLSQGRLSEAETLLKRVLATRRKVLGPAHPDTFASVNDLAMLHMDLGRYVEAETLLKKVMQALEPALGPDHLYTLLFVKSLASLYEKQGRYNEAEQLYKQVLKGTMQALGPEHLGTLESAGNLGMLHLRQGRYALAEPLLKQALAGHKKALGPAHPGTLHSVNNLALLHLRQGRYALAAPLFQQALAGREKTLGPEHPVTLESVNNLAGLYLRQGRYSQAEPLYKRALAGYEKTLGLEHPDTLGSVNNLAGLYELQGQYQKAEPLYKRALAGYEKTLGLEHPKTLTSINNLAIFYQRQGLYALIEPLYRRVLAGRQKALGPMHPDTLGSVNNLAGLYELQGQYQKAEPLYKRALAGYEKILGPEHPDTLTSINNLGLLYQLEGRYAQAKSFYRQALAGRERLLGTQHPSTLTTVNNLAGLSFVQRDWQEAAKYWRRSTAAIAERAQRGAPSIELTSKQPSEARLKDWQFWGLVKFVYRLTLNGSMQDAASTAETFQTAQWAFSSEAAQSLAQMAVRGAKGDPALAALMRERQDLLGEWQRREKMQTAMLGQQASKRNGKAETENRERMAMIDGRIAEIDVELKDRFPKYAALSSPAPLTVEEVQEQLGSDEALVLFLDTPELKPTPAETFVWVVTKTEMRWVRSDMGRPELVRQVQALRCGLDRAAWKGQSSCPKLTHQSKPGKFLPFDHDRAYRLYKALFAGAADLIEDKHLFIVPSGALTQLPFAVLVTAPPEGDHKTVAWLARDHAVTVLPAASSIKALRAIGRPSTAGKPLIGFGNPILNGYDKNSPLAEFSRERQACSDVISDPIEGLVGSHEAVAPIDSRSGFADVALIRRLAPLPETADELCAVASDIGADQGEIRLGARATEGEVKSLSKSGALAEYRIVHFATHGAMAGELNQGAEPGLILTPPARASEVDDGYLAASEIAALHLDADWVILSACNTAAGNAENAEALSGLARAFFYAQARTLLVSHWAVNSHATVGLITQAIQEMSKDQRVGRAEALRRAMMKLINDGKPRYAHPAFWAPFIVVGEGAR